VICFAIFVRSKSLGIDYWDRSCHLDFRCYWACVSLPHAVIENRKALNN
jgi:hypothetical protein